MSKADILLALQPDFAVSVPTLGGVELRPAPAVLVAILMTESEDFADAVENPAIALGSDEFIAAVLDPAQLRPVFERLVAASLPHRDETFRKKAVTSTGVTFAHLALAAFQIALPRDVSSLFRKPKKKSTGWEVDSDPDDIAADIFKAAERLRIAGDREAFTISWTRLYFAQSVDRERDLDLLQNAAVASRVSQADKNGWREFLRSIGR